MKKNFEGAKGFTLVEVLIAIVITVVIGMVMSSVLSGSDKAYRYSVSQSQNAMAVQNVMNAIVSELKYIKDLTEPDYNAKADTIFGTWGSISCNSKSIVIKNNSSGDSKKLADGLIEAVTFQRSEYSVKPQTITITLTVNGSVPGSQPLTTSTTVVLLNM